MQTARRYPPTRNSVQQKPQQRFRSHARPTTGFHEEHVVEISPTTIDGVLYTKREMAERRFGLSDVAAFAKTAAMTNNYQLNLPTGWADLVGAKEGDVLTLPEANKLVAALLRKFT